MSGTLIAELHIDFWPFLLGRTVKLSIVALLFDFCENIGQCLFALRPALIQTINCGN